MVENGNVIALTGADGTISLAHFVNLASAYLDTHIGDDLQAVDAGGSIDWSVGIIYAVLLEKDGATYKPTVEKFCVGTPMNVTDLAVGPDPGAMVIELSRVGNFIAKAKGDHLCRVGHRAAAQRDRRRARARRRALRRRPALGGGGAAGRAATARGDAGRGDDNPCAAPSLGRVSGELSDQR